MCVGMVRRLLALVVACLTSTASEPTKVSAQTRPSLPSVVRIRVVTPAGDTLYGNGAVVGLSQVVTVRTLLSDGGVIDVSDPPSGSYFRATVANVDTVSDVAMLRVPNLPLGAMVLARRPAAIGDSIALMSANRDSAPTIQKTRIRKIETFAGGSLIALPLMLDEHAIGAPAVNAAGELVAITYAAQQGGTMQVWGIPALHVANMLEPMQARRSPTPSTSPRSPTTSPTRIAGESSSPYWIYQGGPSPSMRRVLPTAQLMGRTFLLVPDLDAELRPRYDYRVLLTFTPSRLEARKVMGDEAYAMSYESHTFRFTKMAAKVDFSVVVDDSDQLYLRALSGPKQPYYVPGLLRELTDAEAGQYRTHIATVDAAERARRAQERRTGQSVPLPYLETFDLSGSRVGADLIRKIYYGQFAALSDPRFRGKDETLARIFVTNAAVKNLIRSYHEEYSEYFGDRIVEPTVTLQTDLITYDRWGNVKERAEGRPVRIRTRFERMYRAALPQHADVFGLIVRSLDSGAQNIDFNRMADEMFVGEACRSFLEKYAGSPATIARFEENLVRAYNNQPALVISAPTDRMDLGSDPLRLPGEVLVATNDVLTEHGVSWTRPAGWKKITSSYAVANYGIGTPPSLHVIITRFQQPFDGLLPYLNLMREREGLPRTVRESDQPYERLTVGGRPAVLVAFPRAVHVMIQDAAQPWALLIMGSPSEVTEAMPDVRAFLESFVFTGPTESLR